MGPNNLSTKDSTSKPWKHMVHFMFDCGNLRAPLKTVLFREGGVSRVLTSSCIRPYTPVFRARLPCPHQNAWFLEVPFTYLS